MSLRPLELDARSFSIINPHPNASYTIEIVSNDQRGDSKLAASINSERSLTRARGIYPLLCWGGISDALEVTMKGRDTLLVSHSTPSLCIHIHPLLRIDFARHDFDPHRLTRGGKATGVNVWSVPCTDSCCQRDICLTLHDNGILVPMVAQTNCGCLCVARTGI